MFFLARRLNVACSPSKVCRCFRGIRTYSGRFGPPLAVALNELLELREIVDDMNASSSIEFRWFKKPQVESSEMTEWHCISEEILL